MLNAQKMLRTCGLFEAEITKFQHWLNYIELYYGLNYVGGDICMFSALQNSIWFRLCVHGVSPDILLVGSKAIKSLFQYFDSGGYLGHLKVKKKIIQG